MTYESEPEVRRPSKGTKVMIFGCAILAVLFSFWGIVWFIRSYVEPPRVMLPAPIALASAESTPTPAPAAKPTPPAPVAQAASTPKADPIPARQAQAAGEPQAASLADRWAPVSQPAAPEAAPAPVPQPAPAPETSAQASLTTTDSTEPAIEEVEETSVPTISGPAPLPRRKPIITASVKRNTDPPLPRPRPDGQVAPQSVWTATPSSDDRYQATQ